MPQPLMLVEIYAADVPREGLPDRAAEICGSVTRAGLAVLDAFTMPDDGAMFILVPGDDAGAVERVFTSVGVHVDRVTPTERTVTPSGPGSP